MLAAQIIHECHQRGIGLVPKAGKLIVEPASRLTVELRQAIREHKPDILAALADENALEYVAERTAICEADGLRPCGIQPVFEFVLADRPSVKLIILGRIGESLTDVTASLRDRFGAARVLLVKLYQWPPTTERLQ